MDNERFHELELEVQELRQFALMVILNVGTIPQATRDYWWEKLGSHMEVQK